MSIQVDKSWHLTGFLTSDDVQLLMGEVNLFLSEFSGLIDDQSNNIIEDNQWYST